MSPTIDGAPDAGEARAEAFSELAAVVRHELASILHVVRATIDTCEDGDKERALRRLRATCARAEDALSTVDAYAPSPRRAPHVHVSQLRHAIDAASRRRNPDASLDLELAPGVGELALGVPASVFTLAIGAIVDGFAAGAQGATLRLELSERAGQEASRVTLLCGAESPSAETPRLAWAREELARHGGTLEGPAPATTRDGRQVTAYRVSVPLHATGKAT